jgi:DNA repair protein RecO (recombination protein O)
MPRSIVKTKAIVLRGQRLGETSKLVTLYTQDYGKIKVTAKGARKPKSKFGGSLELMNEVHAVCYLRDERDLQTLSDCETLHARPQLTEDLERLSFGSAACELIDHLTIEGEANRRLYLCLAGVLEGLSEVESEQTEPLFWYYQLRVSEALGYRPELAQCVSCRKELVGPWLWFSAASGGGLCPACGQGNGIRMAGQSLRHLSHLQEVRSYSKEAIPATPGRRGEIRAALRSFLEYHGGGRGPLRALEFLEAVTSRTAAAAGGIDGATGGAEEQVDTR